MPSGWIVRTLDARVDAEIGALPDDLRARFARIVEMIEVNGLERMREPYVKHLRDKLWEMR